VTALRVLAVGDSFVPVDVMERGLAPLRGFADIELLQLDETRVLTPRTPSELRIREFTGTTAQVAERLDGIDVLVVHGAPVTEELLAAAPSLRLIGCARGGPVNVDLAAATARGIPVVTTPGKNAEAVADLTVALLVMLARRLPSAMDAVAGGRGLGGSTFEGASYLGHELGGRTLGLVGHGQVARRVAVRAIGFGMRVVAFDPFAPPGPGDVAEPAADLDEVLSGSDFVSLHARATPQTRGLMSAAAFARMRPGAFFVNTAREGLVDEAALDAALESGRLAGAGLDVVEPVLGTAPHRLLRHDNVVLLPHVGGATHETLLRGVAMIARAVEQLHAGAPLAHLANPDAAPAA
jgi:D-3-phosphoglycerate dehydrogenase